MKKMITTREIDVILKKEQRKFIGITTKNVDASIRTPLPIKKPVKSPFVSTHNQADVEDIAEKKRRDEIMKERYDLEKIKEARQAIMIEEKVAEIMYETVEKGKEAIEALKTDLNNAMEKEKEKEQAAIYQEINELKAKELAIKERKARESKELALKKRKEKEAKAAAKKKTDKERMAKVRAAKGKKK